VTPKQAQSAFEYNRLVIDEHGKWCIMSGFYDISLTCSLRYEHDDNREGVPIEGLSSSRWTENYFTDKVIEEFDNSCIITEGENGVVTFRCKDELWSVTEATMKEARLEASAMFSIYRDRGCYDI